MSKNQKKSNVDKTAAKKAAVLGTEKKSRGPLYAMIACAVVVLAGAFLFYSKGGGGPAVAAATSDSSTPSGSEITLAAAQFDGGQAKYFRHDGGGGVNIRYFLLKASDGTIRSAFDTCDTCWAAGKGYKQDGDVMVCQNCGRRFKSTQIGDIYGGCNPAPLKVETRGGNVVVQLKDILDGRHYFDYSKGG